jgi:hypothetical protein
MAIFVITPFDDSGKVGNKLDEVFPGKFYRMPKGGFLLSADGTSKSIGEALGLQGNASGLGRVLVTSASGYWGYAPKDMWEWFTLHSGGAA